MYPPQRDDFYPFQVKPVLGKFAAEAEDLKTGLAVLNLLGRSRETYAENPAPQGFSIGSSNV
jgi:hypothetical protein